ncbi:MAG TPA: hypothetical protein V6D23_28670 [Candidatus Obscuribacterales bacterium]
MKKLLISSVGSLVAKNILDILDSPILPRRHLLEVVGLNSQAAVPANFRCDRAYLVPESKDYPAMTARVMEILELEKPDLILVGRDEDLRFWARFRSEHPDAARAVCWGEAGLVAVLADKFAAWEFATARGLPYGRTLRCPATATELSAFAAAVHLPVIGKPRFGSGSRGVHLLSSRSELEAGASMSDLVLQEYLSPPGQPLPAPPPGPGLPLAWQFELGSCFSAQVLIGRQGRILGGFHGRYSLLHGQWQILEAVNDPGLEALTAACATELAEAGWLGPVNLEARPNQHGEWQIIEWNLRMTGQSHARFCLGFDELGLLLREFLALPDFPIYYRKPDQALPRLYAQPDLQVLDPRQQDLLQTVQVWSKEG